MKRIAFICGSLEPGRDGVGDYTRRLAGAVVRRGIDARLISIADRGRSAQLARGVLTEEQNADGTPVKTVRMSGALSGNRTIKHLREIVTDCAPDVISLQFVPFSFHPKGLPWRLGSSLAKISADAAWTIMFHELWVGEHRNASWKYRCWGMLQRYTVLSVIRALRPVLINSHTPAYVSMLRRYGIPARMLPLFGNIGLTKYNEEVASKLIGCHHTTKNRGNQIRIGVFFGGFHPEWRPEPLFSVLRRVSECTDAQVWLVSCGRSGRGGQVWRQLEEEYGHAFKFVQLGELHADHISQLLQKADFGVALSPWELIGKSGSVAAMLEHGLPVIVTRDDFLPRLAIGANFVQDALLHRCDSEIEAKLLAGLPKRTPKSRLSEVSAQYLAQLCESMGSNEVTIL